MERWWFQTFFLLTPTWGSGPIWLIFFKWVETTNYWFMASQKWQFSQTCPLDGAWEHECHLQNEISTGIHDEFLVRQTTRWWWFQWCCFYTPPKKNPLIFRDKIPNLTVACGFNLGVPIKSRTARIVPQWAVTKNPGWLGYILTIRWAYKKALFSFDYLCFLVQCDDVWSPYISCAQQINSRLDHWSCLHNDVGFNCCLDFLVEDGYQGCWFPNKLKSPSCYMYDPEYICAIIPRRSESFASRHLFVQCHLRVGEALHPGPILKHSDDHIIVGTINPTQILNKEDVFTSTLGPGIWGHCETAHTSVACDISTYRLRKQGWKSVWSKPTDPRRAGKSQLRGKAGGTCIISHFPLWQGGQQWPQEIIDSTRLVEA